MSLSASRRTWEEASSPAVVRLAREYERAWRDSSHRGRRPDPQAFLSAASASIDGPGARLALLRADMSLRWEAGEQVGARWYVERDAGLSEDTIVALAYEEFCLLEDDEQHPDASEFLARYPEVAPALRRVLDIHGLVGPGTTTAGSLLGGTGSGEHACPFPEAGETIAGFSLVEELGRGAFARVFLARERELADRPVALKVTRRGSREPQTLARLQHTHIVPVHSYRIDRATGLHLLCMPYFGRTTLARVLAEAHKHDARTGAALVAALDRLEPKGGLTGGSSGRAALERRSYVRAIAWWGTRLAEALEHAHDRGVLHRDIKPSNVLVTSDGMPMLLDFNLAREPLDGDASDTMPGGTVDYMSPEHLRALADGEPEGVDHRADIYGLGVVLYESLSGCRPFAPPARGGSLIDALQRAAEERTGRLVMLREIEPDVPPALDRVVARCLAPDPRDRYQSAGELAADLRAVADDQPLVHAREPLSSRVGGWMRRKRRGLAVAAALMLALVASTLIVVGATIGYLFVLVGNSEIVQGQIERGDDSLERHDYVTAQRQFESAQDLATRFGRLDARNYPSSTPSDSPTFRDIFRKLGSLQPARDFNELKNEAIVKGTAAERHAQAEADAAKLHAAADRLRFRLLLELGGFPDTSKEIRDALGLFYVLEQPDWTKLDHKYGLLKDQEKERLREEVNALMFVWVAAMDRAAARGGSADPRRARAVSEPVAYCDRALVFAEPKGPWRALRARLERHGDLGRPGEDPTDDSLEGEPREVQSEDSPLAAFQWGLLEFWAGRKPRSIDWMRRAVMIRGDDYWLHYSLAFILDDAGMTDEALQHYNTAEALEPRSPYVRFTRARLYRKKGKWLEALSDFDFALEAFGDRPEGRRIRVERGYLYQTLGRFAEARVEYDEVIRANAQDDLGRAARLNRGNIDAESGRTARALAAYDELLGEDARDTAARQSRAILELREGHAAPAERDLTVLLEIGHPGRKARGEYLSERAQARLLLGRTSEAMADAVEARRIHPCASHERLAQRTFLAARRYDLLRLDRPEDVATLPLGGPRLRAELKAVEADLGRLAAGRGASAYHAGLNRATILAALGRGGAAVAAANRAAAMSPFAEDALAVRARVRFFAGDRDGAGVELRSAMAQRPDDPALLELRGDLRLAEGNPRGALEDYERAASLGTRDGIHRGRAAALLALGDRYAALEQWSLALRRDPELPEAYLGRARTFFLLGESDQGFADLELAAAWAHGDVRIEAAIALADLDGLSTRPGQLPRLLAHLGRTLDDWWHSFGGIERLAAGLK